MGLLDVHGRQSHTRGNDRGPGGDEPGRHWRCDHHGGRFRYPRGPVRFMSEPWQALIKHAIQEADRLGLQIALSAGPGWCGTGGPWVKPEQSMQHLVASETKAAGPQRFDALLPRPQPRAPFFGEATLTPELRKLLAGILPRRGRVGVSDAQRRLPHPGRWRESAVLPAHPIPRSRA